MLHPVKWHMKRVLDVEDQDKKKIIEKIEKEQSVGNYSFDFIFNGNNR